MKLITKFILFACLAITRIAHAAYPVEGFYAGGFFGGTYQPNINFHITSVRDTLTTHFAIPANLLPPNTSQSNTGTLGYRMLIDGGIQLGYRVCDNYRLEVQALYNKNSYNFLRLGDITIHSPDSSTALRLNGGTSSGIGFFNFYYDYLGEEGSDFVPFAGLGIGYAYIYNSIKFYYNDKLLNPTGTSVKATKTRPAGQVILGFSYFMDDFFSVGMDARYYATPKSAFKTRTNQSFDTHLQVYAVNVFFNGALEFG